MTFETIIFLVCAGLLLVSNVVIIVIGLKKKKQEGIVMDTDDYLLLIMKQIEDIANDAISLISINKDDYDSVDDYTLALVTETKRLLLEDAESYGINPKFLEFINDTTIEKYVHDAVKNVMISITRDGEGLNGTLENNDEGLGEVKSDESEPEEEDDYSYYDEDAVNNEASLEATEPAPESAYDNERNLLKAMNNFYSDDE